MCKEIILFVATLFAFLHLSNSVAVSFIKKCKSDDGKCLKESMQGAMSTFAEGVPELGVEKLDPVSLQSIDASTSNLKFVLTDIVVKGLKDCRAKKLQWIVPKSKLFGKIQCEVLLDGQYDMKGKLLIIPIEGNGGVHVKLRKFVIGVEADTVEKVLDDGKKHWIITSWRHSFDLREKSDVVFENLFEGNEVLSAAARELIANNGNDVVLEIGPPVIKEIVTKVVNNIIAFFKAVPTEDLTLD